MSRRLGRLLVGLLALDVALAWIALQAALVFVQVIWAALAGDVFGAAEPGRLARQFRVLRVVQAAAWVATGGLFLVWIHRVHWRLAPAGPGRAPAARAAVLAFLVPGPNLVRAPRMIARLWRAAGAGATSWIGWWWAVCLASVAIDLLGLGPVQARLGVDGGLARVALAECLRIAVGVTTIVVVGRLDGRAAALAGTTAESPRA